MSQRQSAEPSAPIALRSRVPAANAGATLIDYLATRFRYHDPTQWRAEIAAGRLEVDQRPCTPDQRLRAGAQLTYWRVHQEPWADLGFTIVHQDADLVVVDKPAHLPVHGDGPFIQNTLVHRLREQLAEPKLHLVHRLDRETSGVCVLARSETVQRELRHQFEHGRVTKVYRAVVRGLVATAFVCDQPIGRSVASRIALRRAAGADAGEAQLAITRCYPEATGPAATLLRCEPTTGRTHQIRVHLEANGTPVLGDKLYGRPDQDYLDFVQAVKISGDARSGVASGPDRQLLHASSLRCIHPTSGLPIEFQAPLPPSFTDWLQRWR